MNGSPRGCVWGVSRHVVAPPELVHSVQEGQELRSASRGAKVGMRAASLIGIKAAGSRGEDLCWATVKFTVSELWEDRKSSRMSVPRLPVCMNRDEGEEGETGSGGGNRGS